MLLCELFRLRSCVRGRNVTSYQLGGVKLEVLLCIEMEMKQQSAFFFLVLKKLGI